METRVELTKEEVAVLNAVFSFARRNKFGNIDIHIADNYVQNIITKDREIYRRGGCG